MDGFSGGNLWGVVCLVGSGKKSRLVVHAVVGSFDGVDMWYSVIIFVVGGGNMSRSDIIIRFMWENIGLIIILVMHLMIRR